MAASDVPDNVSLQFLAKQLAEFRNETRGRLDEMQETLSVRMTHIEQRLDGLAYRLEHVSQRIDGMANRIDALGTRLSTLED